MTAGIVIAMSVSDAAIHDLRTSAGLPRYAFHEHIPSQANAHSRHCERSEAIHDFRMHGLPRYARSDDIFVHGPCAVSAGYGWLAMTRKVALDCHAALAMTRQKALDCHVRAYGVPAERIAVIPNGINQAHLAHAPTPDAAKAALGLQCHLLMY